jgi:Tol biopolymer transport system component
MNRSGRIVAAALVGVSVVVIAWLLLVRRPSLPPPPRLVSLSYSDHDHAPDASPDGRMLTFASDRDGRSRIWLKQLARDEEKPLTDGPDDLPRFSPTSSAILFVRGAGPDARLVEVTVPGGLLRTIVDQASEGDWSPDGKRVVFVRVTTGNPPRWRLGIARADGTGAPSLGDPSERPLLCPRWSAEGGTIAVARSSTQLGADEVLTFDAATLSPRSQTRTGSTISSLTWNGDGRLLVAEATPVGTYPVNARITRFDPTTGASEDLLYQPNLLGGIDILDDGRLIVESRLVRQNLREISFKESGSPARWLSHGNSIDRQPVYRPGGGWLAFASPRSGNQDIWMLGLDNGAIQHVIDHPAQEIDPGFTPDGNTLLFASSRTGPYEVWAAQADGRGVRQVTHDGYDAENPTATADGWVAYNSVNPAHPGVWKIRLDGSGGQRMVPGDTLRPEVSPDGRYALYDLLGPGERVDIHVVRLVDSAIVPMTIHLDPGALPIRRGRILGRARWMPDGRTILFVGLDPAGHWAIEAQDFDPDRDTAATRRVIAAYDHESFAESFGISPDGSRLAVALLEEQSILSVTAGLPAVRRPQRASTPRSPS